MYLTYLKIYYIFTSMGKMLLTNSNVHLSVR